jgi:serine protease Do
VDARSHSASGRGPTTLRRSLAVALAATAIMAAPQAARVYAQEQQPNTMAIPGKPGAPANGFADLAEKLLPAVVNISTTQTIRADRNAPQGQQRRGPDVPQFPPGSPFEDFFRDFFDRQQNQQGQNRAPDAPPRRAQSLGSGFVLDATGYVVTNNHVIDGADEIKVILSDDTQLTAKLVGKDPKTDLALLKVEPTKPLPAVKWGNSDQARVGDWVVAIGNPFGLGGTVTVGIVSARQRDINAGPYDDFLQTDASINRGNSGGPMFNLQGEVIGINTAIFAPQGGGSVGIGFAIPANLAGPVIDQIRQFGRARRGWLGVNIQTVTDEIAESLGLDRARGALVARVTEKGPAEQGQIQAGDVVLKFDGRDVTDMKRLPRIVAETSVDKSVKVEVWRKGKPVELDVKVGELDETEQQAAAPTTPQPNATPGAEVLGMTLSALTPDLRQKFEVPEKTRGVLITKVTDGSAAAERGLKAGDVIVEVGQEEVTQPGQVAAKVREARTAGRRSVLVMVESKGAQRFVGITVDPRGG